MYRMGLVKTFKETESWKTFVVSVKIRAPDREWVKKLVEYCFDETMLFEDKEIHVPKIVKMEELY